MEEVKIDKRTRAYKDSLIPASQDMPKDVGCHKCGKQEDLTIISPYISLCPSCSEEKLDFTKPADNPGFTKCMRCGGDLEFNDDGSPKRRVQPELCQACVWRNK